MDNEGHDPNGFLNTSAYSHNGGGETMSDETPKDEPDRWSKLQAENKRLRAERDLALANADGVYARLMPEVERLRAIIKTLREPTDEMLQAGGVRTFPDNYYCMVGMVTDGVVQQIPGETEVK